MIDELRKNIDSEIEILREIARYNQHAQGMIGRERNMIEDSISSLRQTMKIINNTIPEILNNVSAVKKISVKDKKNNLERVSFRRGSSEIIAILNKKDKERFIRELSINERLMKKIGSENYKVENKVQEYTSPRGYLKISNRLFLNFAEDLIEKGWFKSLSVEIKKANIEVLTGTYVSMIFFTVLLSLFASIILALFFLFFNFGFSWPIITLYSGDFLARLSKIIFIPIVIPMLTFGATYIYPSTEKDTISKKIERELPFAAIHMGAISGSGIAPVEIFKIIGTSRDYPYLGKEIRKVLNQINLYGYDLVTALNNISRTTPSAKLSELFSGLTTTMSSGGSLQAFFEKRAETLLMDYRLEREKYTRIAETFMDIYITIVVAAPMILMLLLIMVSMTGFQISFGPRQITLILVSIIALLNIIFLGVLQAKQPGY